MYNYSVIIPVYRGEGTIEILASRIKASFLNRDTFEIIFVFDNGPDNSWGVIKKLVNEDPDCIRGIKLSRNFGQHNAIICGIKHSKGRFIITMDEDLQHLPEDIYKLIDRQKEKDYDVVYGKYQELKHNPLRNYTSWALKKMLSVGIPELHRDYTAFRLIRGEIAAKLLEMNNSYTFLDGYLSWITNHVGSTKVSHEERFHGKSSYTLRKLVNHAINIFVTFSLLPVRIVTYMSFLVFLLSVFSAIYLFLRKLIYDDLITGYASTMIVLGLGFGLILFGIGVIGEYIYRINLKTTRKPNFVESEML